MERLSRTAFQYGSCRLFVWRRCSPVQQMSAHRSVLQAALLRQSLIARFGACIEGFAHLDSTQTRMAHSSVCCSSSASPLRSYDPPNPSVERSFAKSRESRSLQALVINVRPSTNHASSTPPPEIQTQFLVWYPSLRLCCSPIGRSVLSGMSIQIHRSNSLANVFRAQQDKSQRIDLVCFLFLTRLFSPNASTASVISCLCLTPQCTRRD